MDVVQTRVHLMGTVIDLQVEAPRPREILEQAVQRLRVYEHRFSANDPASELGEVNGAAGGRAVRVHPELFDLIALGVEHSRAPGSMLNIAIGPLVQLWRIGFADAAVPEPDRIRAALALTDPSLIELDARTRTVRLGRAGMKIDLGALAKGFIADRIVELFAQAGAASGLVNLGGNVRTFGAAPGRADGLWRAGLRHPRHPQDQLVGSLALGAESMVTSGVYQRRLVADGRVFHHLLDPRTGMPIETEVVSLTVVTPRSVDGEIWTSRLFGMSVAQILAQVEALPGAGAGVITQDLRLFASPHLRERLTLVG